MKLNELLLNKAILPKQIIHLKSGLIFQRLGVLEKFHQRSQVGKLVSLLTIVYEIY